MRFALALVMLVASVAAAEPRRAPTRPTGVLAVLIDQSGSMRERLDAVKAATKAMQLAMYADDTIMIVGFNHEPTFYVRPQRAANTARIEADLDRMTAFGGTDLLPALKETAEAMRGIRADRKHVIVMTDGEFNEDGIPRALEALRRAKVTVSTIGIGDASNDQIGRVATGGAGRSYRLADLDKLAPTLVKELDAAQLKRPTTAAADPSKPHRHNGAVALLIDRSSSMDGVRLDAAKAAVTAVRDEMNDADFLSVIAFNDTLPIVLGPTKVGRSRVLVQQVDGIQAGGSRVLLPALKETADRLRAIKVPTKHVILVTTGTFYMDGLKEVIQAMRQDDVTFSAVALRGADRRELSELVDLGGGRLYMVERPEVLPRLLAKETRDAALARN